MLLLSFLMEPFTLEPVSSGELVLRSHLLIPLWVTVLGTQLMGTNNTGGVGGRERTKTLAETKVFRVLRDLSCIVCLYASNTSCYFEQACVYYANEVNFCHVTISFQLIFCSLS